MEDKSLKTELKKSIRPKAPSTSAGEGKDEASVRPQAAPDTTSELPKRRPQR